MARAFVVGCCRRLVHIERMMLRIALALLLIASARLEAQAPATPPTATPTTTGNNVAFPMWRCSLPGGNYSVALRSVVSVSTHEYLVDGVARVTEVNIDTTGSILARFYYIEPATPNAPLGIGQATLEKTQQLLNEATERTGQDVWKKVVKNYPTTTHARTVEYRLTNRDQINTIFSSAEEAFRLNKNTTLKVE
jgi:hypothetical protein